MPCPSDIPWLNGGHDGFPPSHTLSDYIDRRRKQENTPPAIGNDAGVWIGAMTFGLLEAVTGVAIPESLLLRRRGVGMHILLGSRMAGFLESWYQFMRAYPWPDEDSRASKGRDVMRLSGDAHSMLKKEFERWPAGAFSPDRFTVEERDDILYPIYSFVHALSHILQQLWPDSETTEGPTRGLVDKGPVVFPSYKWSRNSCWLDVTLEILWNITLRDFQDFADCFARASTEEDSDRAGPGIYQLYQHLRERHALHAAGGASVSVLTEQRDRFREVLEDGKIIDNVTSCENAMVSAPHLHPMQSVSPASLGMAEEDTCRLRAARYTPFRKGSELLLGILYQLRALPQCR